MDPRHDEDIVRRLEKLLSALTPAGLASAYVFGSRNEGRAHRQSDLDIGILLSRITYPGARERFDEQLRLRADVAAELGSDDLDIVVLNDAPPGLGREIVVRGRRIYCSDLEADHAFVRDVQLKAADLEPFLRRMRKLKLEAIAR